MRHARNHYRGANAYAYFQEGNLGRDSIASQMKRIIVDKEYYEIVKFAARVYVINWYKNPSGRRLPFSIWMNLSDFILLVFL